MLASVEKLDNPSLGRPGGGRADPAAIGHATGSHDGEAGLIACSADPDDRRCTRVQTHRGGPQGARRDPSAQDRVPGAHAAVALDAVTGARPNELVAFLEPLLEEE